MIPLLLVGAAYIIGKTMESETFAKGGSVPLLAPNGKPSNLTPEQWYLVRTPEFKAWFGDWKNDAENASKVIDENGEPLVVYHFTNQNFYYFDKKLLGKETKKNDIGIHASSLLGFWFNNNKDFYKSINDNFNIKKVFLDIKDVIKINKLSSLWGTLQRMVEDTSETYNYNGSEFENDIEFKSSQEIAEMFLEEYISYEDGIFIVNDTEFGGSSFIVFEPEQIKLADGTNTTFDGSNPDIRYEEGGEVDYSNFRTSVIGLFNKGKILILQRGSTANWMPNKWSIVGGVVDEGENPKEAIIRECFEEVGLKPKNVSFDYNIMTDDSGKIYYYHGNLESDKVKLDYENSNYAFISKSEIDNYDFVPHVKDFIIKLFSKK
jgi:8-oxo-dGTP pyrophosphatase MutT (NUDIX family)